MEKEKYPSTPPQQSSRKCYICLEEEDTKMLTLQSCSHSVHQECIKEQLAAGWTGKRISFGYMSCGECRNPLFHRKIKRILAPHYQLKQKVEQISYLKCLEDNIFAGLKKKVRQHDTGIKEQCVETLACFLCTACQQPFCGGRVSCSDDSNLDVSTLTCESCAFEVQQQAQTERDNSWRGKCSTHGYKYAMYKCDSCCAMATFDCRSNHYCARCHDKAYSAKEFPCPGPELCPLGIDHPPNQTAIHGENQGEFIAGFVVGCFKCFTQSEQEPDMQAEEVWQSRF